MTSLTACEDIALRGKPAVSEGDLNFHAADLCICDSCVGRTLHNCSSRVDLLCPEGDLNPHDPHWCAL